MRRGQTFSHWSLRGFFPSCPPWDVFSFSLFFRPAKVPIIFREGGFSPFLLVKFFFFPPCFPPTRFYSFLYFLSFPLNFPMLPPPPFFFISKMFLYPNFAVELFFPLVRFPMDCAGLISLAVFPHGPRPHNFTAFLRFGLGTQLPTSPVFGRCCSF